MKYVNEWTVGGAASVALTAVACKFAPVAALTFPVVAGLAVASAAAVAASYGVFLGSKAAYNYFTAKPVADEPKGPRRSPRLAEKAAKQAKGAKDTVVKNAKSASESVSNGFSSAWQWVKSWFVNENAAKPAKEAAKPAKEAAKPAKEAAKPAKEAKEAAKPVTPAFAKAKAKPAAAPAARPARERKQPVRLGFN